MGGVIYFDMLYIPPQPKKVANWVICELEHPQVKHQNVTTSQIHSITYYIFIH